MYGQMLSMVNGGACVAWGARTLNLGSLGVSGTDALIAGVPAGSDGLRFRPLLSTGGGASLPRELAGRLDGLRLSHAPSHIMRALIEGLACELGRYLHLMKIGGVTAGRLVMCGGAAASTVTPGIIADTTGLPVDCVTVPETSSIGAAVFARGLVEPAPGLAALADRDEAAPAPRAAGRWSGRGAGAPARVHQRTRVFQRVAPAKEEEMTKTRIGLLPLYLKLYDDLDDGSRRPKVEEFPRTIAAELGRRGVEVVAAPVCRVEKEFAAAVKKLEAERVDALVTLHLAYSPSLESSEVLAHTPLPLIVLDTTPTFSYAPDQDPDELMYNHGIHGVQDMCNLLLRNGKPFLIEAGHWQRSDVLDRVAALAVPARMAAAMRRGRVGMLGTAFKGMGDFFVPAAEMKSSFGAKVKTLDRETLQKMTAAVKQKDVDAEIAADARFTRDGVSEAAHVRSVRLGLAIRRWTEKEELTALTFNFLNMVKKDGYATAPFLEMSKAMERGIGYAGEGDTLTALLVGALAAGFPETSFTEMFCPDWEHNAVFLSHMGEVNPRLLSGRRCSARWTTSTARRTTPPLSSGVSSPARSCSSTSRPWRRGIAWSSRARRCSMFPAWTA